MQIKIPLAFFNGSMPHSWQQVHSQTWAKHSLKMFCAGGVPIHSTTAVRYTSLCLQRGKLLPVNARTIRSLGLQASGGVFHSLHKLHKQLQQTTFSVTQPQFKLQGLHKLFVANPNGLGFISTPEAKTAFKNTMTVEVEWLNQPAIKNSPVKLHVALFLECVSRSRATRYRPFELRLMNTVRLFGYTSNPHQFAKDFEQTLKELAQWPEFFGTGMFDLVKTDKQTKLHIYHRQQAMQLNDGVYALLRQKFLNCGAHVQKKPAVVTDQHLQVLASWLPVLNGTLQSSKLLFARSKIKTQFIRNKQNLGQISPQFAREAADVMEELKHQQFEISKSKGCLQTHCSLQDDIKHYLQAALFNNGLEDHFEDASLALVLQLEEGVNYKKAVQIIIHTELATYQKAA